MDSSLSLLAVGFTKETAALPCFLKKLRFACFLKKLRFGLLAIGDFSLSLWDSKIVELESAFCELCGVESLAVGFVISVPLWDSRIFELETGLCVFFG
ncbi:hypothetical protein [Helicobacter zhangjianzhongii]|uniref:hypothetical protein n=1 Tax=Helicobacter zhangjianzhongii TaxID=2974574 RepID=UPI002554E1B9|nr:MULTISPECIES: hypothetical protein [unclassified Helicobacter]MDL0080767.1 hypothetical protein [Helicobacter sp. CPD2-1]